MDEERFKEALKEAETLTELTDESLYEQLGIRIEDIKNIGGYKRSTLFAADFAYDAETMGLIDDLKDLGKRWWDNFEPELMKIICDENNEDMKKITGGMPIPQIAASLATTAVVAAMAPPAWLIVATSIIAGKIVQSGLDTVCGKYRNP